MNTKDTLLENIHVTQAIAEMIGRMDFSRLEEFVILNLSAFVRERKIEVVQYDLNYDVQTPTDTFITHLLEQGSVQLLREFGLLQHEKFIDALYVIISSINIVVADFLRRNGIAEVASYRYFDADPQFVLLERAVEQVEKACRSEADFLELAEGNGQDHRNGGVFYR